MAELIETYWYVPGDFIARSICIFILVLIAYVIVKYILKLKNNLLYFTVIFLTIEYLLLLYEVKYGFSGGLTFGKERYAINFIPFVRIFKIYGMGIEKMIILLLFNLFCGIPFGLFIPYLAGKYHRFSRFAAGMVFFFVFIELLQYFVGRVADINDVIMHVIGGMIGYGIYCKLRQYAVNKAGS